MKNKKSKKAAGGYSGISPKDVKIVDLDWNTSAGPKQQGKPGRSEFRLHMQFEANNHFYHVSTPLLPDSDDETEQAWIFKARHALVQLINKGKSDKLLDEDNNFKPVTSLDSTNLRIVAAYKNSNKSKTLRKISLSLKKLVKNS